MDAFDTERLATLSTETFETLSGLEILQRIAAGDLPHPPVAQHSHQRLLGAEHGKVIWECSPPDTFLNPLGTVHGGWALTVLDSALGCAVHSALPAGQAYTTVEVKTNLTRGPKVGVIYRCEGTLITLGRRIGTSEAKMFDPDGKVVAFGTSTCILI